MMILEPRVNTTNKQSNYAWFDKNEVDSTNYVQPLEYLPRKRKEPQPVNNENSCEEGWMKEAWLETANDFEQTETDQKDDDDTYEIQPMRTLNSKQVNEVLQEYQNKYGTDFDHPITTVLQGENMPSNLNTNSNLRQASGVEVKHTHPTKADLIKSCKMKPSLRKQFRVDKLGLEDVACCLLNATGIDFFEERSIQALACCSSHYAKFVPMCKDLRRVNFEKLREERLDYEEQKEVSKERITMANACMLHYGGDPRWLARYCGNEYTGEHRDVEATLNEIKPYVDWQDYVDIERILNTGTPFELTKEVPKEQKQKYLSKGNCPSVEANSQKVIKAMNKEDKQSHLIPVSELFCYFSPYIQHVPQTMNLKKANIRLCWNGSKVYHEEDVSMNQDVDMENEPLITFGNTNDLFMRDMYNMRITWPEEELWLATADIKSCFRFPRIHPCISGAFSFVFSFLGLCYITTAMVFGYVASANCWEPFRRAIEVMSRVIFERIGDGSDMHQTYIDMLNFSK
jgi:hypothetical protein